MKLTIRIQQMVFFVSFMLVNQTELFAQKNPTEIHGTVSIDYNISMDATEVTIEEWVYFIINNDFNIEYFPNQSSISKNARIFFSDLQKQKDFEYIEVVENSKALRENYGQYGFKTTKKYKDLMESDTIYFSTDMPIVGISFKQAKKFCEWREGVINKSKTTKINVNLPTLKDYNKVNENKDSLCRSDCPVCKGYQINYSHVKCIPTGNWNKLQFETQGQGLMSAKSYWPSSIGLYNIQGNAAEMTSIEGVAAGGSFRHFAKQSFKNKTQQYTKEEDWLGFRCIISLK
jgi:formylglycine-generating enzyme required for sulfatase activity